jgi:hypothetical protein
MKVKLLLLTLVVLAMALMSAVAAPGDIPACSAQAHALPASIAGPVPAATTTPAPTPTPEQTPTDKSCLSFCSKVLCVEPQTCGLYTDGSGKTVCGCH